MNKIFQLVADATTFLVKNCYYTSKSRWCKEENMSHAFKNLRDGELLSRMGASWFVSYAYHNYLDKTHKNWQEVSKKSAKTRIAKYNGTTIQQRRYWLGNIITMSDARLNRNGLALSSMDVKQMAQKLLQIV